ncbi:MAG: isoprenyl transferase [Saprospiraceae bacterium]|nr:isoprenyl transferase [Saprospiraceae bacterium]
MELKDHIIKERLPRHVAIIMDGNGRWAKQKMQPRVFGHRNGVKAVRAVTEAATELGIEYLTLYAFSTENWNRPRLEVNALMSLLLDTIHAEVATMMKNNVRLNAIGDLQQLPEKTLNALLEGIQTTRENTRMTLTLALNYSARWEIREAVRAIAQKVSTGDLAAADISDAVISAHMATKQIPDPDLLIRTSGESRISNFLLWQIAYTELYFTDVYWPEYDKEQFYQALVDYQARERRFGKTSDQLV